MIKKYLEYLKDNPEKYWFKRKLYGWGWTPATWQGWLILFVFIALIFLNAISVDYESQEVPIYFLFRTSALVLILILICWKKGEKPRWQWGIPDKTKK